MLKLINRYLCTEKSLLHDASLTFIVEAIVLFAGMAAYSIAARVLVSDEFGQYMIVRRVAGSVQPFVLLGLGVALPRYLPLAVDDAKKRLYALCGISMMIALTILFALFICVFSSISATLLLGNSVYSYLMLPLALLQLSLGLHFMLYAYFRGCMHMRIANILQLTNLGIIPVVALFWSRSSTGGSIITVMAVISIGVTSVFLIHSLAFLLAGAKERLYGLASKNIGKALKEMLSYGIMRVPGFVAMYLILIIGPWAVARYGTMTEVAYISAGYILLRMSSALCAPIGLVLLPRCARGVGDSGMKSDRMSQHINNLFHIVVQFGFYVSFTIIFFADDIVRIWLGNGMIEAKLVIRVLVLSMPFYMLYEIMRNPLDAATKKAINTVNLIIALVVMVLIMIIINLSMKLDISSSVAASSCGALILLGLLTLNSYVKYYTLNVDFVAILISILASLLIVGAEYYVYAKIVRGIYGLVLVNLIGVLVYLFILYKMKVKWLLTVRNSICASA